MQKSPETLNFRGFSNVRKMGLEPTRCDHHKILSLARLPIPTLPRTNGIITKNIREVNNKFQNVIREKKRLRGFKRRKNTEKSIDISDGI